MNTPNITIDLTPTWKAVLPIFVAAIESGTSTGRLAAVKELTRMADAADKYNEGASQKEDAIKESANSLLCTPRIEVYCYLGYNGGFAQKRQMLWVCDLVGADGKRRRACEASWHGNPEKKYATKYSIEQAEFSGWPIFDLGMQPQHNDAPKN